MGGPRGAGGVQGAILCAARPIHKLPLRSRGGGVVRWWRGLLSPPHYPTTSPPGLSEDPELLQGGPQGGELLAGAGQLRLQLLLHAAELALRLRLALPQCCQLRPQRRQLLLTVGGRLLPAP